VPDPRDYATVLAARAPLEPLDPGITTQSHRVVAATVQAAGRRVTVVGLYVPSRGPRERRNQDKRAFQHAVAAALPDLVKRADPTAPLVVAGDLNVVEPGHRPHHAVFGAWEYDFYRAFAAAGLRDAFRHLHPDADGHSWFGRSGAGFRFDHLFVSAEHAAALSECRYLHSPRELGLSDHAALLAAIRLP
jgi:exonuclease III